MRVRPVGVGVVGLGFMGRRHVRAFAAAAAAGRPNRLVAVCDRSPERRAGRAGPRDELAPDAGEGPPFDPSEVRAYERADELLADPAVEFVAVCTYTESHVPLALAALAAGRHVLVEKPVALGTAQLLPLLAAARAAPALVCLPAMCMRFWPGWSLLAERVRDGRLGALLALHLYRHAPVPAWASAFYGDVARCGGVLFDLHVHDVDLVRWLCGRPSHVQSEGDASRVSTRYLFAARAGPAPEVRAEASWDARPGARFRMGFRAVFEGGVAEWRSGRDPPLVLQVGERSEPVPLPPGDGYDGQVRHALALVEARQRAAGSPGGAAAAGGTAPPPHPEATLEEALDVTAMLEAEAASQRERRTVEVVVPAE